MKCKSLALRLLTDSPACSRVNCNHSLRRNVKGYSLNESLPERSLGQPPQHFLLYLKTHKQTQLLTQATVAWIDSIILLLHMFIARHEQIVPFIPQIIMCLNIKWRKCHLLWLDCHQRWEHKYIYMYYYQYTVLVCQFDTSQ